jgi:ribosomal protein S18 acetylase RimI-like enzyme
MLRHGLLRFLRDEGLEGMRRMLYLRDRLDAFDASTERAPHWYLHMMAVRPDLQGRGHGTALVEACLATLVDRDRALPCTLLTQRPENVVFYGRLGFREMGKRDLGGVLGQPTFVTWAMRRDRPHAQPAHAARTSAPSLSG